MVSQLAQGLPLASKPRFLAGAAISAMALLLSPGSAQAIGFEAHYAFNNWTQTLAPGNTLPVVDNTATPPQSVTLNTPSNDFGFTSFTIVPETTGRWSFNYSLAYQSSPDALFSAGYVYYYGDVSNIIYNFLLDQSVSPPSGRFEGNITRDASNQLPTIGFYIQQDSFSDFPLPRGIFTITNLDVPGTPAPTTPVPEPSSLALLAIGAMGLRRARRAAYNLKTL